MQQYVHHYDCSASFAQLIAVCSSIPPHARSPGRFKWPTLYGAGIPKSAGSIGSRIYRHYSALFRAPAVLAAQCTTIQSAGSIGSPMYHYSKRRQYWQPNMPELFRTPAVFEAKPNIPALFKAPAVLAAQYTGTVQGAGSIGSPIYRHCSERRQY